MRQRFLRQVDELGQRHGRQNAQNNDHYDQLDQRKALLQTSSWMSPSDDQGTQKQVLIELQRLKAATMPIDCSLRADSCKSLADQEQLARSVTLAGSSAMV